MRTDLCPETGLIASFLVFTVDRLQACWCLGDGSEQKCSKVGFVRTSAGHNNLVQRFRRLCRGQYGMKAVGKGPKHDIGEQNSNGHHQREMQITEAAEHSHSGRAPDGCSGVEAAHVGATLCANISETSSPSTITVGRGKKSHFDKHEQDKYFFRCVGSGSTCLAHGYQSEISFLALQ